MNSGGDSDRQQDEKARKSLRSGEGIGTERPVSPEEILPGGETLYLQQLKVTHRARARARGNEVATAIPKGVADVV